MLRMYCGPTLSDSVRSDGEDVVEGWQGTDTPSASHFGVSGNGRNPAKDRTADVHNALGRGRFKSVFPTAYVLLHRVALPLHIPLPAAMEHIAGTAGGTTYTAAETGKALLEAMDAEEPFKLLSALPRRLEELRTIQGHLESTEVGRLSSHFPIYSAPLRDSLRAR